MVRVELELSESDWEELIGAVASKALLVRGRHYGDFDPMDGFDPDEWATRLEVLHQKLEDLLEGLLG